MRDAPNLLQPGFWLPLALAGWLLGVATPLLVGQVLAFLRVFSVTTALMLSALVLPGLAWLYARDGAPYTLPRSTSQTLAPAWIGVAVLLWALMVVPVLLWPRSALGGFMGGAIAWDVVYYHLPKAADLVQRGHMWNLALPYGQYPLGWETLLALSVGLSHRADGLGPASAVALVGFMLAFAALLHRETDWPVWGTILAVGGMMFSFYLPVPNNPWREFGRVVHYTSGIGKNDVLAAALLLTTLVHLPLSRSRAHARLGAHPTGVGLALAAALAVKPHAGLLALALVGVGWVSRRPRPKGKVLWAWLAAAGVGSLWLVRNLLLLGRPFSPIADILARRALMYALPQKVFWVSLPKTWLLVSAALVGLTFWAARHPSWRGPVAAAWVLYGGLLGTPASARLEGAHGPVAWRFGLALLAWIWVLLWAWVAPYGRRLVLPARVRRGWRVGQTVLALALTVGLLVRYGHRLRLEPEHGWLLNDPFPTPVGRGGYHSVFDFIHRQVRDAVIDFDGAPPWYVYGPGLTNRPVRPGHYPAGMPAAVPQPKPDHWLFCAATWQPHGRVADPDAVTQQVAQWQAAGRTVLYADTACALARAEPSSP